ncbi:MAG: hypothetical protein ACI4DS_02960 [Eubacterium sp.]
MGTIQKHIRKASIFQIILPAIFIVAVAIIMSTIPFRQIFSPQQLYSIWDCENAYKNGNEYVTLTIDKMYYTGYDVLSNGNVSGSYYYCLSDDKCIFILANPSDDTKDILTDYTIKAKVIDGNRIFNQLISNYSSDLNWNATGLNGVTADIVLSEPDYTPGIYIFLLMAFILTLAAFVGYIAINILYVIKPAAYPICARRDIYDNSRLINRANAELSSTDILHVGTMYITKHFFIDLKYSRIIVIPLGRLAWAYRLGTKNIFHKHKPHYSLYFTLKNGLRMEAHDKSPDDSNTIIRHLTSLDYNIICGYTEEKKQMVKAIIK